MQPMNVTDQRYFKPWLKHLGALKPEKVWRQFISSNQLPAIDFDIPFLTMIVKSLISA